MSAPEAPSAPAASAAPEAPSAPTAPEPVTAPPAPVAPSAPAVPAQSWRSGLPDDLRDNPLLGRFESPADLAKSYLGAQKFIGGEKIPVPQESWQQEDYNEFYKALGRPESADGYELTDFAPPEGIEWSPEFQTGMVAHMHSLGLNQAQVRGILDAYGASVGQQFQQMQGNTQQETQQGIKDLEKKWGTAYPARVDQAKRAFVQLGGDRFQELADIRLEGGRSLGDHPMLIEMMADLGEKMGEHGLMGPKTQRFTQSPSEAAQEEKKLLADEGFTKAYLDNQHPEHDAAVAKMRGVHAAQVGTAPVK